MPVKAAKVKAITEESEIEKRILKVHEALVGLPIERVLYIAMGLMVTAAKNITSDQQKRHNLLGFAMEDMSAMIDGKDIEELRLH
jgi:hypothetical protein